MTSGSDLFSLYVWSGKGHKLRYECVDCAANMSIWLTHYYICADRSDYIGRNYIF